jgi:hypothetical protein
MYWQSWGNYFSRLKKGFLEKKIFCMEILVGLPFLIASIKPTAASVKFAL